ncbi:flagellar motor switch protein FliN [Acidithiobacillus sp.]|uniref:flagellar motor switch protein FliN n=1 Tax=Acidithiobacillus sp. TaxID=1872118 RepID=UPI00345838FE
MAEEQIPVGAEPVADAADNSAADDIMADWAAAMAEQGGASTDTEASAEPDNELNAPLKQAPKATPAPIPELHAASSGTQAQNLDMILDIPVTLSVELGRTKIQIRNLLQLAQGSVVELERLAGEPMDVLVNGYLIAQGEVVLVNDKFGIRLTDIVSPAERAKKLR